MRTEPPTKTDKATLAVEALSDDKIRVRTSSWEDARVILKDQVLELRNMEGQIRIARKTREPDDHDVPTPIYDPYGPGSPRRHRHSARGQSAAAIGARADGAGHSVARK
jgi:hypothetical protein